jgi:hypothetical protein
MKIYESKEKQKKKGTVVNKTSHTKNNKIFFFKISRGAFTYVHRAEFVYMLSAQ